MSLRDYLFHEEPGITLYCGDNQEVLRLLPPDQIDLVLTSPPYNLGTSSGGGFQDIAKLEAKKSERIAQAVRGHYPIGARLNARGGAGKWSGGALARGYGSHDDAMPHDEYVNWQHHTLYHCWGLLTDVGAIYYNHKPRVLDGLLVAPIDYVPDALRPYVRQEIIWARAGGVNFSPAFYVPTHERIVIVARRDWRLRDKGASGVGDVWYIPQESDPEHPAPFPLRLALQAIETTPATLILDPFAGSGTTLQAAKTLGRSAIGIEIEPRYCEIAVKRLRQEVLPFPVARAQPG
jgi:site-specific DNA-methyltransferase (adenine-specific)